MYRGRKERVEFTQSFLPIYHFRLLYLSGAGMYPIMGAMRMTYKDKWRVSLYPIKTTANIAVTEGGV